MLAKKNDDKSLKGYPLVFSMILQSLGDMWAVDILSVQILLMKFFAK